MVVKTLNSMYHIKQMGQFYQITKIDSIRYIPNELNEVGQIRISRVMSPVTIGHPIFFDKWMTSTVVGILE